MSFACLNSSYFQQLFQTEHEELLLTNDEVEIYRVVIRGEVYILKRKKESCLHEFLVGSGLKHENTIQTIANYQNQGHFDLILEVAVGIPYSELLEKLSLFEKNLFIRHLSLIICDIQGKIKFTHYDLHTKNIIVHMNTPQLYTYTCFGKVYPLISPFQIKLIDYESSYLEGVRDTWVTINNSSVMCGMVPSVFDDFFDLAFVVTWHLYDTKTVSTKVNQLLLQNSFIPYDPDLELPERWDKSSFLGREYNPNWERVLYTSTDFITDYYYNTPVPINMTIDDFLDKVLIVFGKEINISPYTSQGQVDISIHVNQNEDSVKNLLLRYRRDYGGVIKFQKERNIKRRTVSPKMLLETVLEEF